MRWGCVPVLLLALAIANSVIATGYVFEQSIIKGTGYRSHELFGQTSAGQSGQKINERISGSGRFYDSTTFELDASTNSINFTQEAEFEYFPVSYKTGSYDGKWKYLLCARNYDAGAAFTEMYSNAEHLEKSTELSTYSNRTGSSLGVHISSNVIGVAHIGWSSTETTPNDKGRFFQLGTSREDAVGVISIEKYVELAKNSTGSDSFDDWLPCS